MFTRLETFLIGFAAVFDTVLLLVLREPINRRRAAVWLKLLAAGAWAWHSGSFLHTLLRETPGNAADLLDRLSLFLMCCGLLLLPSAMLHAAVRLTMSGLSPPPRRDLRCLCVYLPILALPLVGLRIAGAESRDFLRAVEGLELPFLVWLCTANAASVMLFLQLRDSSAGPEQASFLRQLSGLLLVQTALAVVYVRLDWDSGLEPPLRLITCLSPLVPAFLFMWNSLRQRVLPIVMERTIVYGALLAIILLFHHTAISPLTVAMERSSQLDLVLVEGMLVLVLILAWQPLRMRVRESLRYLVSGDVRHARSATREISLQLCQMGPVSADELIEWFRSAVTRQMAVRFTRICVYRDLSQNEFSRVGTAENGGGEELCESDWSDVRLLSHWFSQAGQTILDRAQVADPDILDAMERLQTLAAFRLQFGSVRGIALLGGRHRSDCLAAEQLTALALLFDQFSATLHNRRQDAARLRAERQAMQQEKLSTLGLLTGSLAHELRNPLSSMRAIATMLLEDLGQNHAHAADVRVILSEIDRLATTTQRLLEYSRPADESRRQVAPDHVIERLLRILRQLSRQQHVTLATSLAAGTASVATNDATLSEILFNLIRNAIEAAHSRSEGRVVITSACSPRQVVICVSDNGPGIDPALQDCLFDPFVTSKADGTGLGLYVAAERVRELNGTIRCSCDPAAGTLFEVCLPRWDDQNTATVHNPAGPPPLP